MIIEARCNKNMGVPEWKWVKKKRAASLVRVKQSTIMLVPGRGPLKACVLSGMEGSLASSLRACIIYKLATHQIRWRRHGQSAIVIGKIKSDREYSQVMKIEKVMENILK